MTTYGWDMSHYDAPSIGAALSEGIQFITHKAGGDANDAEVAAWWNGVKPLRGPNLLLGAYWVQYPGNPKGRADAFLARLDSQCPGWQDGPFILQVDCEKWNGDASTVPSKAEIRAFCDRLAGAMPKLLPIVYAPKWVYGDTLTGLGYPLWASAYVNGSGGFEALYPGDGSSKWGTYSGQAPAILQYTSSATIGGQTTCDANAFRGTLQELTALVAPGWIEDDMPLNGDDKKWISEQLAAVPPSVWTQKLVNAYSNLPLDAGTILRYVPSRAPHETTWAKVDALSSSLMTAIQALAAKDTVDEQALGAALAAGVVALLPVDRDDVTVEELTAAIRALIIPAP